MRFPRNAKIFRGQLDAAPLAGVFFLLLIFLLLASLIYTPGTPIQFSSNASFDGARKLMTVSRTGRVVFENQTYRTNSLDLLRDNLKKLSLQTTVVISGPDAPREIISTLRDMARVLGLSVESSGIAIELPSAHNSIGTDGPTVVVSINLTGQFFFENQLIAKPQLQARLTTLAKQSREPLTLMILADKDVQNGVIQSLTQLANQAGIHKGILGSRPVAGKARP